MPESFKRHYVAENWRRTWLQWKDRRALVSFAALVLAIFGAAWVAQSERAVAAGLWAAVGFWALQFLVFSPWAMWDDASRKVNELEERLQPQLRLVFKADELPYVQELEIVENNRRVRHRNIRVGIQNDSAQVIQNARVVLESFGVLDAAGRVVPARLDQPALIEHALNVMGFDDKHGFVNVAPGDRPTAFVDVVGQWFTDENPNGDWMSVCYSSGHRPPMPARTAWVIGLRVEGGGTYHRATFRIGSTLEDRKVVMQSRG
jgi:hypothetical protein